MRGLRPSRTCQPSDNPEPSVSALFGSVCVTSRSYASVNPSPSESTGVPKMKSAPPLSRFEIAYVFQEYPCPIQTHTAFVIGYSSAEVAKTSYASPFVPPAIVNVKLVPLVVVAAEKFVNHTL